MVIRGLRKHTRFPNFREALIAILTTLAGSVAAGDPSVVVSVPYLGCVSDLGRAADNNDSANYSRSMTVTTRTAQDAISAPYVLHHNFFSNATNTDERLPGGPCTYRDWIEYPIGVAYYGGATVTAGDGEYAVNNLGPLGITIPAGAKFRIWTFREGAQVFTGGRGSWHLGAGYLANPGVSERIPQLNHVFYPNAAWVNAYWPTVLDMTTKRSVLCIGDSHESGEGERGEPDMRGYYGLFERFFKNRIGWTNMATRGMSLQGFIGSHARRVAIAQYFSDVYLSLGGNDANAGRNSTQMLADLDTCIAYFPGKDMLSSTELPKTNSTDSWTTTANQTAVSQEAASREFSRAKMYGRRFKRVYDFSGASFFKTNGVIVHKPGVTTDGNHLTETGYELAVSAERMTPLL